MLLLFKNRVGYQQGQLKPMNRGQATLMELDLAIWKHRYSGNFKRPRKGNNVVDCFFLKHEYCWHVAQRTVPRIPVADELQKELHIFLGGVLLLINLSDSEQLQIFFFVCQCTNCTMYVVCNSNSYSLRPKKNATLAFPRSQTISSLTKFIQKITNIYVFK